ncbi:Hypothetical_protein [Hexamita inflata]|uniref:Hypothetical_protein n=1 Tax=Hexamita inflata TaxID=28002 RepID=A0AA86UKE0_9EUKA|nr:Hypothetical protein HINF_LOCUS42541 [Hexamita inflata]
MRECWSPGACGRTSPLQQIPVRISKQTQLDRGHIRSVSSFMHLVHQVKRCTIESKLETDPTLCSYDIICVIHLESRLNGEVKDGSIDKSRVGQNVRDLSLGYYMVNKYLLNTFQHRSLFFLLLQCILACYHKVLVICINVPNQIFYV